MEAQEAAVHVRAPGGEEVPVPTGGSVVFGRSRHADVVVRGDPGLSRLAGQIDATAAGARISNLSTSHSLVAVIGGQVTRLPPVGGDASGTLLVDSGSGEVGSPYMHGGGAMITVRVHAPVSAGSAGSADLPAVDEETETRSRLRLDPHTKEFVTALMLCRGWLSDASRSEALPTSVQVAREALAATHTWDQLRRFDAGQADVRARVTRRVDEHLRSLKAKLADAGVLPEGSRVTKGSLAHHLVALQVLVPDHLQLLEDEDWLEAQADLWWDA